MSLDHVGRLLVPVEALKRTENSLRAAGREGFELFVLWSGTPEGDAFCVKTPHVPRQTAYRSRRGLLVRIEGDALHELNRWLYEHGETLGAQVHAHPSDAYHSETDDSYPIVTVLGGFSIVAADFARRGLLCEDTAVYRLTPNGWLPTDPAMQLIEVI
jgi:hypothetical protein